MKTYFLFLLFCSIALPCHGQNPEIIIRHFDDVYAVGDVNDDTIADTATVSYDMTVDADGTLSNDCGKHVCYITASFGKGIAPIKLECYGMRIDAIPDVNGDGANEILLSRWWIVSSWYDIDVYTYKGNKWQRIATAKAFDYTEDEDMAKRIVKHRGRHYLIGDAWTEDNASIVNKSVKIKG